MGDVQTDRLIFALDARLSNYQIRAWRQHYRALVSQRGWTDNFVFGAVQGVSYEETDRLLRTADLERPTALIHMVADPDVAFERIRHDPDLGDKYETRLVTPTPVRGDRPALRGDPETDPGPGRPSRERRWAVAIDTTMLSPAEVARASTDFLSRVEGFAWLAAPARAAVRQEAASARA